MGLRDLFKSKSSRLKADPRVRWFGKLPTYADYYGSHVDDPWAKEFQDWILKGFELYRGRLAGEGKATARIPVAGAVVRLPESEMTVLASILDFGGDMRGRPFPICFFVALPTAQWPGPTSEQLGSASQVIGALLSLGREVPRFLNSPGHFETVFGGRELDLSGLKDQRSDDSWTQAGKTLPLSDWFNSAKKGMKIDNVHTWLRLANRFGDNLAGHESAAFEPTLRFPLSPESSPDVQTAGWLRWLESRIDLPRRTLSLVVSTGANGGAGHFTVIARKVVIDDFLLLTPLADSLPYLDNLAQVHEEEGSEGDAVSDAVDVAHSWLDFASGGVNPT